MWNLFSGILRATQAANIHCEGSYLLAFEIPAGISVSLGSLGNEIVSKIQSTVSVPIPLSCGSEWKEISQHCHNKLIKKQGKVVWSQFYFQLLYFKDFSQWWGAAHKVVPTAKSIRDSDISHQINVQLLFLTK